MVDSRSERVGVIGAGMMGSGIALAFALAGIRVDVHDIDEGARVSALERWQVDLRRLVDRGRLSDVAASKVLENLTVAKSMAGLADCALVVEAVYENAELKRSLLSAVEAVVGRDALVATNTSTLSVAAIAGGMSRPQRLIGMHFFVPAHLNRMLEVVVPDGVSADIVARARRYGETLGKDTLICRDTPGFVVNRFYLPLINEAARAVDEGLCGVDEADKAAVDAFGIPVGPFAVCNLGNPKTTLAAVEGLQSLGSFYRPARSLVVHAENGTPWPLSKARRGDRSDEALIDRMRGAVFFAIHDAIDHGVADPADFDRAASIALRFEKAPVALMKVLGAKKVEELVAQVAARHDAAVPNSLGRIGGLAAPPVKTRWAANE